MPSLSSTPAVVALLVVALFGPGCLLIADEPLTTRDSCGECQVDRECPGFATCFIDDAGCGRCRGVACVVDDDCDSGLVCDPGRGRCEAPLICDSGDPDVGCGPADQCLVLDVQGCRPPPVGDTCALWPPSRTVLAGPLAVTAVGRAADGRLVPAGRAVFAASLGGEPRSVDPVAPEGVAGDADQVVVDAACAGPGRCILDVTAGVGAARCQARYVVVPAGADDDVRVIVTDRDLGARVVGAAITVAAEGSVVAGVTDEDGVFLAPGIGRVVDRVTIVAPGFEGWSCLGCRTAFDVALPRLIDRTAVPAIAGAVDVFEPGGDIVIGLAGLPLATPSFETADLWGAPGSIPFEIDGVTAAGSRMAFASAGSMRLGTTVIREGFVAFGRPGGRTLWAFGAGVALSTIGGLVGRSDVPRDLRLEVLRVAGPAARSGLLGSVVSMPVAVPPSSPGLPAPLENLRGPGDARVLADVDVAADVDVTLTGPLPEGTSDVIVMVGAVVPGEGLIPLGGAVLSATASDGARGVVPAPARVPFAPPHDGLEGRALRLVVIAVNVDDLVARDALGQNRTVVALPAPGPGRTLAVTLPPFAVAPAGAVDGRALVIDRGDMGSVQLGLPLPGGGTHVVDVDVAATGSRISVGDVIDDLILMASDPTDLELDLGSVVIGSRDDVAAPGRDPWDQIGRTARR